MSRSSLTRSAAGLAVRSRQKDLLRDSVARATTPHEVTVRAGELDGLVIADRAAQTSVVFVRYGGEVIVEAPPTDGRFVLTVPLGPMGVGARTDDVRVDAFVLSPRHATLMAPHPWEGAIVAAADSDRVHQHLAALLGRPVDGDVDFLDPGATKTPLPASYADATARLVKDALAGSEAISPAVAHVLEQAVLSAALLSLPHTYSAELCAAPAGGSASHAEVAREWMTEHHSAAVTVPDVASAIGLSVRQLQTVIRDRYGMTPSELLRETRLTKSRELLRGSGHAVATVAEVAHLSGFSHLGRFAVLYRRRFGESPSTTLAGSR